MRIAVTGATGFVGCALVPLLQARGHQVAALGREVTGELTAFRDWPRVLEGSHVVVHLAALAHTAGVKEARLREVNFAVATAIGRAAAECGARMMFLSSIKALGDKSALPLGETRPHVPLDAYGLAKADAERALSSIAGLRLTILRPPLVYGPGVKGNFLLLLHAVARGWPLPLASIDNRRSLVYLGNLCDAIAHLIESPRALGGAYCVSDGVPVSTPALCRALSVALGCSTHLYRFPAALLDLVPPLRKLTRSLEIDDGPLRIELPWTAPFTMEDGLRGTARWYRQRGAR